ncbi:autophagy protein Apg6-domain-containing protein [Leucosporidium creatinivorum]|uniref:Autophagy protein Apg6-domain-containing protein n=1 Tax=Leucosporidium creatinivorum TaxID=106004 RepID=A0A1Y2G167_9BASI|nr:autophagy protein Apg6-domain-containing protein [Leucosporidium creatinivorum]
MQGTCQKCRQPLLFDTSNTNIPTTSDSISALSRSSYDLLSASERRPLPPQQQQQQSPTTSTLTGRLPQARRTLYQTATQPRSTAYPINRGAPPNPNPTRLHVPSPYPATPLGPADSFVVLDHVAQSLAALPPTRSPGPSLPSVPSSTSNTSIAGDETSTPAAPHPLTPHLTQLTHLTTFLSSRSSIDHPLCTECMDLLLGMMGRELEEGKKEKERLGAWEREVLKRREGGGEGGAEKVTREGLQREIAKYRKAERLAITDLKSVESERLSLDAEIAALDLEEAELAKEEEGFWRDHSSYILEASSLRDRTNALQTRYEHDMKELEKLQKTNVYNDAFCIGQEAGFGTINGLRLGRLPHIPVEWPEINAAWGHTLLLLHTIARKFGYTFVGWRLVPMGSFSWIERLPAGGGGGGGAGAGEVLELYGTPSFALNRLLQNRRFDQAMVAVHKDKIGDVSIKLQFGSEETWTRALRHNVPRLATRELVASL